MKNKLIAAVAAAGCLLGFQASALAQDLAEHPPLAIPSYGYPSGPGTGVYNSYGRTARCNGTYDVYNDTCYPADFQGPSHS